MHFLVCVQICVWFISVISQQFRPHQPTELQGYSCNQKLKGNSTASDILTFRIVEKDRTLKQKYTNSSDEK